MTKPRAVRAASTRHNQGPTTPTPQPGALQAGRTASNQEIAAWEDDFDKGFAYVLAALFGGLLLFVLIFGLCVGLGLNGGISFLIAFIATVAVASQLLGKTRKNVRIRTAPARSRSIPQWVKIAVAHRDGGKCRRCGSAYYLQYDHIVPYSLGGKSDDPKNIQLLCARCNRRKSNRYVG